MDCNRVVRGEEITAHFVLECSSPAVPACTHSVLLVVEV